MSPALCRAGIAVLSSLAQEHTLAPGESFQGSVLIRNTGNLPETARVFQTDYAFKADGSNDFGPPGALPRSNAGWLAASTSLVRLAPGETLSVPYHGRMPTDSALSGSYWSILMIESTSQEGAPAGPGISVMARYGVQIITHVGATGSRSVRFAKRETARQGDNAYLLMDLENDSERLVLPKLWVELYDQTGRKVGRFGGASARIYPACAARYRIELPSVPAGEYHALIMADCGEDQMVGTQCSLAL